MKELLPKLDAPMDLQHFFLNNYMDAHNIQEYYYALNTFSGFVAEDIKLEVADRAKTADLFTVFQINRK